MNTWITLAIVLVTYAGIAIGHWPRLKANRTTIALMGAGMLIATRQIEFSDIGRFLDMDTLVLLFSMMIINANLRIAGFFRLAGGAMLRLARGPRTFLALEIILTGVLSAFFLNDTICLMFTPLVLGITLAIKRNPIPYLIALATAANVGSTATLTGNPQNMIIGTASGISYTHFAGTLTPVAFLGLGGIWLVLVKFYPYDFRPEPFPPLPPDEAEAEVNRPMLIKSLLVLAGLLVAFLLGVPVAEASFLAACVLLFTRRLHPEQVFAEFDWSLLVFFAALFIVTGSLEVNGITAQLSTLSQGMGTANIWAFSGITVVLSNLVSNVPAVLLLRPVVATLPNPEAGWLVLAAASTLAGNLTLLGSVANLIVAEIASRWRVHLGFWEYTKAGLVITLISLLLGITWLQIFIWK
ncbi:MAG TPA: anion transporter [Anaerolineaceae bacterium]|nr:anion transporter [Anaerolineaceae bacterium]